MSGARLGRAAAVYPAAPPAPPPRAAAAAAVGAPLTLDLLPRLAGPLAACIDGLGPHAPADLSAANLWLFRHARDWRYVDGARPVVSGRSYDGRRHLRPLFDPATVPAAQWPGLLAGHEMLFPLTAREARALSPDCWTVDQHRDDADYIYPADHFRDYRGTALQKKANLMRQCQAAHRLTAEPYRAGLAAEALAVLDGWLQDKGKAAGDADAGPCRDALAHADTLGLAGFLHWADGEPAGFVLAERLQPGVLVVRFAKGLARFKGIAQHMFHHLARHAAPPVQWINFEQDLGLPNFRHTKLSYRPALLLPKWRAHWRAAPGPGCGPIPRPASGSPQDAGRPPT